MLSRCRVKCCPGVVCSVVQVLYEVLSWCRVKCCPGAVCSVVQVPCVVLPRCRVQRCPGAMCGAAQVLCAVLSRCSVWCCPGAVLRVVQVQCTVLHRTGTLSRVTSGLMGRNPGLGSELQRCPGKIMHFPVIPGGLPGGGEAHMFWLSLSSLSTFTKGDM